MDKLLTSYNDLINESMSYINESIDAKAGYLKELKYLILHRKKNKKNIFFWDKGLVLNGLYEVYKYRKDSNVLCLLNKYFDVLQKKQIVNCIDNFVSGYVLLCICSDNHYSLYDSIINKMYAFLKKYPVDCNGSFWYNPNIQNEVLIDSIGMVCPFLSKYSSLINEDIMLEIAKKQIINFINFGIDKNTQLPYHGFNIQNNIKLGIIGWGRGVGWYLIGIIKCLENMNKSDKDYNFLAHYFNELVDKVLLYQRDDGGFSWQLVAVEGHIDTSATSMIAYAIAKGIKINVLSKKYLEYINLSVNSLLTSIHGGKIYNSSAECRGISLYPQLYGAFPWSLGTTTSLLAIFENLNTQHY